MKGFISGACSAISTALLTALLMMGVVQIHKSQLRDQLLIELAGFQRTAHETQLQKMEQMKQQIYVDMERRFRLHEEQMHKQQE